MRKYHWPIIGIVVAVCLFIAAGRAYPGGTLVSSDTVGYSWTRNFISSLFATRALNGADNPARYFAMSAMLFLCISLGLMFVRIASAVTSPVLRKTIQIAGIGSAVYGFLVVTRMHDLMIDIGLLFGFTAMIATTHAVCLERRRFLFAWGVGSIALSLVTAAMYYSHQLYGLLPVVQKVHLVVTVGWIIAVYYALNNSAHAIVMSESVAPIS